VGAVTPQGSGAAGAAAEGGPYQTAPILQLGPCNWLIGLSDVGTGRSACIPNFGLATLDLQHDKSQGQQGTGALHLTACLFSTPDTYVQPMSTVDNCAV
jgi:hypothetical protein